MEASEVRTPSKLIWIVNSFNTYMSQDLLGGRKILRTAWAINTHKILTPLLILVLMLAYRNYTTSAWLYLSLHSSYCICWLTKHIAFRDPKWEVKVTVGGGIFTFLFLGLYWVAPFLLISGLLYDEPRALPPSLIAICITLVLIGTMLMMVSDCQKRFTLKYRPGLITGGMFSRIRHPNYLGEMMVYAGFALVVGLIWPWLVLAYFWIGVFLVNIYVIEESLSRYAGWPAYKDRSGMLVPKFFWRGNQAA